ncbi:hypothetical protein [Solibacillus sp. FSL H8-0538]|uniref:hypothetical protein n=1 Tax=Solibacillus sp. FSL H8-0538 TaxID=2921400 RepID=UPI0030FBCC9A
MHNLFHIYGNANDFILRSTFTIRSIDFTLVEDHSLSPQLQQLPFEKDNQFIRAFVYLSNLHEEHYLLIEECALKNTFVENLVHCEFYDANLDVFLEDGQSKNVAILRKTFLFCANRNRKETGDRCL